MRAVGRTLVGEREVEWAWTLAHVHRGPGRVLDFGSGNGMIALGASFAGNHVVAVDLEHEQYPLPRPRHRIRPGRLQRARVRAAARSTRSSTARRSSTSGSPAATARPTSPTATCGRWRRWPACSSPMATWCSRFRRPRRRLRALAPDLRRAAPTRLLERWAIRKESYWTKREPRVRARDAASMRSPTRPPRRYYALGLYVVAPR